MGRPSHHSRFLDIVFPCATMKTESDPLEGCDVNIEIRDAALEARTQGQLHATGLGSVEEVLLRLLETKEEQDHWLSENRDAVDAKIKHSIDQLDRGEGIREDQLNAHLAKQKKQS
jgi:hypothetical protein